MGGSLTIASMLQLALVLIILGQNAWRATASGGAPKKLEGAMDWPKAGLVVPGLGQCA